MKVQIRWKYVKVFLFTLRTTARPPSETFFYKCLTVVENLLIDAECHEWKMIYFVGREKFIQYLCNFQHFNYPNCWIFLSPGDMCFASLINLWNTLRNNLVKDVYVEQSLFMQKKLNYYFIGMFLRHSNFVYRLN